MRCLLILFAFTFSLLHAQDTLNRSDAKGKQGHWICYGKDRPESGYPDSVKYEEGSYVDNRKTGRWIRYYNDGKTPKLVGNYVNNRPKDTYLKYDRSGVLIDSGTVVYPAYLPYPKIKETSDCSWNRTKTRSEQDTLNRSDAKGKQGRWIYYGKDRPESGYPDSAKYEEGNYVDDRKEGRWVRYNPDGTFKMAGTYVNNRPQSRPYTHTFTGSHLVDSLNTSGSRQSAEAPQFTEAPNTRGIPWNKNGYNKVFDRDNEPLAEGEFREGKLWNGKAYRYDSDGILLKIIIFKNGIADHEGQF